MAKKRKKASRKATRASVKRYSKAQTLRAKKPVRVSKNRSLLAELWGFLKERKAWWLTPIIVMLILAGLLIILGQSSAVSPFIYALF